MATSHERAQWRRFVAGHIHNERLRNALRGSTCIAFSDQIVAVHIVVPKDRGLCLALAMAVHDWFGHCPPINIQATPAPVDTVGDKQTANMIMGLAPPRAEPT